MHILITGSSGYIGTRLHTLVAQACPTALISVCDAKQDQDYSKLNGHEFDVVFHMGAISTISNSFGIADKMMEVNAFGLIPFLRNNLVRKFVFASTGAVYGTCDHPAEESEASWNRCLNPYAQSKYVAENIIRDMCPNHVICRLGNPFGGNTNNRVEKLALDHFKHDNPIVVYGGNQSRDFIYLDVVCYAFIKACSESVSGTFNISNGEAISIRELAERFARERGVDIMYEDARPEDALQVVLNPTKARQFDLLPKKAVPNDYRS